MDTSYISNMLCKQEESDSKYFVHNETLYKVNVLTDLKMRYPKIYFNSPGYSLFILEFPHNFLIYFCVYIYLVFRLIIYTSISDYWNHKIYSDLADSPFIIVERASRISREVSASKNREKPVKKNMLKYLIFEKSQSLATRKENLLSALDSVVKSGDSASSPTPRKGKIRPFSFPVPFYISLGNPLTIILSIFWSFLIVPVSFHTSLIHIPLILFSDERFLKITSNDSLYYFTKPFKVTYSCPFPKIRYSLASFCDLYLSAQTCKKIFFFPALTN